MRDFILKIAARRDSEDGQAMVEYGLILALVSVVAIGVLDHRSARTSRPCSQHASQNALALRP